jgi:hypothetical protein
MTKIFQGLCFLKWSKNLFFALLLVIIACNNSEIKENSTFSKLQQFFNFHHINSFNSTTRCVFVISEQGCMGCNKGLSKLAETYINNKSCVFIIEASGAIVDVSIFENANTSTVFMDTKNQFQKLGMIEKSGVIFLKNNIVDTIINLDVNIIDKQFEFIESKIK